MYIAYTLVAVHTFDPFLCEFEIENPELLTGHAILPVWPLEETTLQPYTDFIYVFHVLFLGTPLHTL